MKKNAAIASGARDPFSGLELFSEDAFRSLGSMEAVDWAPPPPAATPVRDRLPGVLLALGVTAAAFGVSAWLTAFLPVGFSALAMLLGIAIANLVSLPAAIREGCRWIVATAIPLAVVLVGTGLDLGVLVTDGFRFLGYLVLAVGFSSVASLWLGKRLSVAPRTALLVGAGTGICGSSAILAVAPLVEAEDDDVMLSVGAINLVGLVAMFACIGLGQLIPFDAVDFGILTGATIHAVPTVTAAALDHGPEAAQVATLVKMGRVAMLVPFVLLVSVCWRRGKPPTGSPSPSRAGAWKRVAGFVPWFVWGFVIAALAGTLGMIPQFQLTRGPLAMETPADGAEILGTAGKWLLALAMAAIGLQVQLRSLLAVGARTVISASLVWLVLAAIVIVTLGFS